MDAYLIALCRDYVDLVDQMRHGQYSPEELRDLDSARQVAHQQLAQYAGLSLDDDAYQYARAVLHAARGGNYR